jgi:hypothetical protein
MAEGMGRRDFVALAALVLAAVGIPLLLAAAAGAIGLPSNDDWVYIRAASSLFETGRVDMPGHTTAFVGQLALVQPFLWLSRGDPWAFTAFGLVMAAIGIVATYLLARRFVGTGSAVIVVLLVIAFPGFARSSASFMTDVPAYALIMLCLLLGTRWLDRDGERGSLVASLVAGLLAASIREFALAAPIAVLLVAWARSGPGARLWLAGVSIILAAGVVGVLALSAAVSGHGGPATLQVGGLIVLGPAFSTLAAVLLPATLLYVGQRFADLTREQIIVAVALVCFVVLDPNGPLLGNLWTAYGLAGNNVLTGPRDPVIGGIAWVLSRQLAIFAAILAAIVALSWAQRSIARTTSGSTVRALAVRIASSREGPLVLFLLGYAAELVLFSLLGGLFDRYLYPMVPVAAILILRRTPEPVGLGRTHAFAHGAFAWLIISAFIIAANSFAYDAARYREGEAAVALGYDAQTVDAGYEWVGSHGSGTQDLNFVPTGVTRWYAIWPSFRACAVLSNTPLDIPAYELIRENRSAYRQYLLFGPAEPLYLYGARMEGCPSPPSG